MGFVLCVCLCMCFYAGSLFYLIQFGLFVYIGCLFSERERKKAQSWMSGEDLGDNGRRETSLRYTVYEKLFSSKVKN